MSKTTVNSLKGCSTSSRVRPASRAAKLSRSRRRQPHQRSKTSNYYGSSCDEVSESGGAFMDDARMSHAYYALIVQTQYEEWRYVTVSDHGLGVSNTPILFSAGSLEKLLGIWERVVCHNAIPWHDNVCGITLRLISYSMDIQEVTKKVLGENYNHLRKTAALMMMDDKDARLLDLTEAKAKQVLFHQPEFEDDDERLLKQLNKESTSHNVDNLLVLD